MRLVRGVYDTKAKDFMPDGVSLQNCMLPYGPDAGTLERASTAELKPHSLDNTRPSCSRAVTCFAPRRRRFLITASSWATTSYAIGSRSATQNDRRQAP